MSFVAGVCDRGFQQTSGLEEAGYNFDLAPGKLADMAVELKVPAVGESITEVQIGQWLKGEGQTAEKDESLVEIETDKATVEIVGSGVGHDFEGAQANRRHGRRGRNDRLYGTGCRGRQRQGRRPR